MKGGPIKLRRDRGFFILLIIMFLGNTSATLAKKLNLYEEKIEPVNPQTKLCLREILTSYVAKAMAPDILESPSALSEFVSFCDCTSEKRLQEITLKQEDRIAWQFYDHKLIYENKDLCALEHLDTQNLELYYAIIFSGHFSWVIETALNRWYSNSIKNVATKESYQRHLSCLMDQLKIMCTKVKSLRLTYNCIQTAVKNHELIQNLSNGCPQLRSDENDFLFNPQMENRI